VTLVTGYNGHGKSLMWGQLMINGAIKSGEKACIASLEMSPRKTLGRIARQACGTSKPRREEYEDCRDWYNDKLWIFDLVGTGKIERLLEVFRYAYRRHGIMQFVVDSLMKCGVDQDDFNSQKKLMEALCDFATETDVHVHIVVHPRKGQDEYSQPNKMDIKGTGALTDLAFNVFSVGRHKVKEEAVQHYAEHGTLPAGTPQSTTIEDILAAPDAFLICSKARNLDDGEGKWPLFFDKESQRYTRNSMEPRTSWYETAIGPEPW
jgi:twinkle protein